jgi:hypothetical protein
MSFLCAAGMINVRHQENEKKCWHHFQDWVS